MTEVRWTRRAKRRLQQIGRHIGRDNPRAAMQTIDRLWEAGNNLERNPESGRIGRMPGTRELVVLPNYIVIYRVRKDAIHIVTVQHAARRYPD